LDEGRDIPESSGRARRLPNPSNGNVPLWPSVMPAHRDSLGRMGRTFPIPIRVCLWSFVTTVTGFPASRARSCKKGVPAVPNSPLVRQPVAIRYETADHPNTEYDGTRSELGIKWGMSKWANGSIYDRVAGFA